jgi:hypothetical protein
MKVIFCPADAALLTIVGNVKVTENRLGRAPSPIKLLLNSATLKAI